MSKRIVNKNFCVRIPNGDAVIMKRKTTNCGNLEWKLCLKADMETGKRPQPAMHASSAQERLKTW